MARKRSGSGHEEVEANLTSMLDLIFNILAFFVVTFDPPKPEKNFDVSLPPPKQQEVQAQSDVDTESEIFEDITITLMAGPDGSLAGIQVEQRPVPGISSLAREIERLSQAIGGATQEKLEVANIVADPKLKYRWLIAAVDSCYQAKIQKINFAEARAP